MIKLFKSVFVDKCKKSRGHFFFKKWPRILAITILSFLFATKSSFAHPSPNTLIFLDMGPGSVSMELQLPVPELALSFNNDIAKDPEKIIEQYGPQLKEYLLAHIHAYVVKGKPWQVLVKEIKMNKGLYVDTDIPYWEVNATINLIPAPGDNTRDFFLDYDVIMHQVINHAALVSVRTDWENGTMEANTETTQAIGWDLANNNIPPLHVNLQKGNWWKGFSSMVILGIRHIADGTDHLMFLLVLLLPAPLLSKNKRWNGYGGVRYSLMRLLKIVTAFTIGHSVTLLLGAIGWVQLPVQLVEILIAVSILVSAVHAFRPLFPGKETYVAAGFGLVHGMAFAATLVNLQLKAGAMALSILGFNIGIELMQLFVIAITIPWLIILSKQQFVYNYVRIAGAVFAGMAAIAWMVQRYLQKSNLLSNLVDTIAGYSKWIVLALAILAITSFFIPFLLKRISQQISA
ncbi:MAG: HupE/UreJ family protein [Chitinophagaceae bacterium]